MSRVNSKYDVIGKTYNQTRKPDERIVNTIIEQMNLNKPATIVDIGAGTGNYSYELAERGFNVLAVEPSKVMRDQATPHANMTVMNGVAENIPLADAMADAVICILATHHFQDLETAFHEMSRILKENGKLVMMIADPRLCGSDCWVATYFSPIFEQAYKVYKPLNEVTDILSHVFKNKVQILPFLVPHDIEDKFFVSAWRKPEYYLQASFRAGVSPLANAPAEILTPILEQLTDDLGSGQWEKKYGHVLKQDVYEGGYRFLVCERK
ncbi:class I SAM-dependent methyltransferase [Metabacillus malikii]|uniref:Ubiquinone/menaquinone biosynthesis C-methylase UbiE n=1 Tax=Metabacillus malikii TaxID=1504265 RepID=A0ABT9ZA63_9BACI|nr:class I SAM-dependent methyltransferase [Metabacillus malikii]MDQ0229112.1 ubiquinone/menaquinone biosynthesis C-methylase UbiE [Metabacillus malikii]